MCIQIHVRNSIFSTYKICQANYQDVLKYYNLCTFNYAEINNNIIKQNTLASILIVLPDEPIEFLCYPTKLN